MPKKEKQKSEKYHIIQTRQMIKQLLKKEKTLQDITEVLGVNIKVIKMIIKRWGLQENLRVPTLSEA